MYSALLRLHYTMRERIVKRLSAPHFVLEKSFAFPNLRMKINHPLKKSSKSKMSGY